MALPMRSLGLSFDGIPAGHISFQQVGVCASGNSAYVGLVNPSTLDDPDKLFVEMMGGAACFNEGSCTDHSLRRWTDIRNLLVNFKRVDDATFNVLTSGTPVPLAMLAPLDGGWIPGMYPNHPLAGRRGVFMAYCSADIGIGRVDVKYDGSTTTFHHGGMSINRTLTFLQETVPNAVEIAMFGGSGGGVASAAWMANVAQLWPQASIKILVDSGFHMMPGTQIFRSFSDTVPWSSGLGERSALSVHSEVGVPAFNWLSTTAIAEDLARFKGRVKIAYVGCVDDYILFGDRELMGQYVEGYSALAINQTEDMWHFLTSTHKCAPTGTIASYVMNCREHHPTRSQGQAWATGLDHVDEPRYHNLFVSDAPPLRSFVYNFLNDQPLDAGNPDRYHFWFDEDQDIGARGAQCAGEGSQELEASGSSSVHAGLVGLHLALVARLGLAF